MTNTESGPSGGTAAPHRRRRLPTRFLVLALVFFITALNYADRASLSITGSDIQGEIGFNSVQLGYIFSAFSWAYVVAQLPGGVLLDRFGARRVYAASLGLWTLATLALSLVGLITLPVVAWVGVIFGLRLLLGVFESPAFPANARVTATWFPTAERGRASAIFSSAQYFASAFFAPLMAWVTSSFGWRWVFTALGVLGLGFAALWLHWMRPPRDHQRVTTQELQTMVEGGALVDLDSATQAGEQDERTPLTRSTIRQILSARPLWGVYVYQYALNALTYFFITWFPIYLSQGRGLSLVEVGFVAALPAICAFGGGLLTGFISDWMIRRGWSLTAARKLPAVIGMVLCTMIAACALVDDITVIVAIMTVAFFGKGLGMLGWAITTDLAPVGATSFVGSTMNGFGNIAGIVTPIVIGYAVETTNSFDTALLFVGAHGILGLLGLAIIGTIKRIELRKTPEPHVGASSPS